MAVEKDEAGGAKAGVAPKPEERSELSKEIMAKFDKLADKRAACNMIIEKAQQNHEHKNSVAQ
mgnify:CR=1 FL=1